MALDVLGEGLEATPADVDVDASDEAVGDPREQRHLDDGEDGRADRPREDVHEERVERPTEREQRRPGGDADDRDEQASDEDRPDDQCPEHTRV